MLSYLLRVKVNCLGLKLKNENKTCLSVFRLWVAKQRVAGQISHYFSRRSEVQGSQDVPLFFRIFRFLF